MSISGSEQFQTLSLMDGLQDFVLLFDEELRLMHINSSAAERLELSQTDWKERSYHEVFSDWPVMLDLFSDPAFLLPQRRELTLLPDLVVDLQVLKTPGREIMLIMHDVTRFVKQIDMQEDFARTAIHDLRSPLTAIFGYAKLVEQVGTLNETQQDFIRRVISSAENIRSLLDDVLFLVTFEIGEGESIALVQLNQIVQEVVGEFTPSAQEQEIKLDMHIDSTPMKIYANTAQLRLLVTKLIDNAISFTPSSGRISVVCKSKEDKMILQVSDNGIGIPKAEQSHIFNRFFRASNVSQDQPGTGLGLAVAHLIVEHLHGQIRVDSEVNKGSTFTVILSKAAE